ncbi:MAG: O-antigen ligase family protein [Muribaculaceae bacterium]|nr:O-antigen ligase family protein [Muribaculaceae bacterium]
MIALYIFSCAFPRLFMPLYYVTAETMGWGTFGNAFRMGSYFYFIPYFMFIQIKQSAFKIPKINILILSSFAIFIAYIALNTNNTVISSSYIPIFYFVTYAFFLYLIIISCSLKTIINGIYLGFSITVCLHLLLAILFPVLDIKAVTTLFFKEATVRSAERAGAVGTFGHPNNFAVYASYYFMFFIGCVFTKFRYKNSIIFAILSFVIIILTMSRSALMGSALGLIMIIALYIYREHKIFSPKIIFKGILPAIIAIVLLLVFTPLSNLFFESDMDEMMLARSMHYLCGIEIFKQFPITGFGLNSHLKYMSENLYIDFNTIFGKTEWLGNDFIYSYPIHNTWLVILCETGIIGITTAILFIGNFFFRFKQYVKESNSTYFSITIITALGIICCLLVQGNSDWAPLTPTSLNISLLFFTLSLCKKYRFETENNTLKI